MHRWQCLKFFNFGEWIGREINFTNFCKIIETERKTKRGINVWWKELLIKWILNRWTRCYIVSSHHFIFNSWFIYFSTVKYFKYISQLSKTKRRWKEIGRCVTTMLTMSNTSRRMIKRSSLLSSIKIRAFISLPFTGYARRLRAKGSFEKMLKKLRFFSSSSSSSSYSHLIHYV